MLQSEQPTQQQWLPAQSFGSNVDTDHISSSDIISAVQFDPTGEYLATGDKGGRVTLFERQSQQKRRKDVEYQFSAEFQSHEPQFDYLTSADISEAVKQITWCKRVNAAHLLLTANDKTIKLWKVYGRQLKAASTLTIDIPKPSRSIPLTEKMRRRWTTGMSILPSLPSFQKIPKEQPSQDTIITAVQKRAYANAHAFHIHSVSMNSDGETFISADDLRIYLWHLDIPQQTFNIIDMKPLYMEELTQVITSASFHPQHCNLFLYGSSNGTISMADTRVSTLCDKHAKLFALKQYETQSFFSDIINSISDVKFSPDGRYLLSRDYLTLKLWDVNMESKPFQTMTLDHKIQPRLPELYDAGYIFDKFECDFSGDGKQFMTGSYNNELQVYGKANAAESYEKSVLYPGPGKAQRTSLQVKRRKRKNDGKAMDEERMEDFMQEGRLEDTSRTIGDENAMDCEDNYNHHKRPLHYSWHPKEDAIAVAIENSLHLFCRG